MKELKDFPDYYVDMGGHVYSNRRRIQNQPQGLIELKPVVNFEGYLIVSLYKDGKRYQGKIHRLVAETFLEKNEGDGDIVRHLDDDKQHNDTSNLAWGFQKDNSKDMIRNGGSLKGERNPSAKLTISEVQLIRIMVSEGKPYKVIADLFGITKGHISNICARRVWKDA